MLKAGRAPFEGESGVAPLSVDEDRQIVLDRSTFSPNLPGGCHGGLTSRLRMLDLPRRTAPNST